MPQPKAPLLAALLLAGAALPALAQEADQIGPPLDAAAFDARTLGRTLTYSENGSLYGREEYLPGHRVLWAFAGGPCHEGTWSQQGTQICFDYSDTEGPQCWTFHDAPKGLVARFNGKTGAAPLVALSESTEPLVCPGPETGV